MIGNNRNLVPNISEISYKNFLWKKKDYFVNYFAVHSKLLGIIWLRIYSKFRIKISFEKKKNYYFVNYFAVRSKWLEIIWLRIYMKKEISYKNFFWEKKKLLFHKLFHSSFEIIGNNLVTNIYEEGNFV